MRSFYFNENSLFFMDFADFCDSQLLAWKTKRKQKQQIRLSCFLKIFFISLDTIHF